VREEWQCGDPEGGREALHSNKAVSDVLIAAGEKAGLPKGSIQFVNVPDRAAVDELIHLEGLVDVVISPGRCRPDQERGAQCLPCR
jgi:gamma-glutamyl phosphate reductase